MTREQAFADKDKDYKPRTKHLDNDGNPLFINHLIFTSSPYLLQHAHNPVNWYAWGDKALQKAQKENKLIFLSIGYATCHWCHVMEEESFDDTEVAAALNKNFISIKVDREVRPDIDEVFMAAVQLINGSGGWPLNIVLTPDGRAFFGGTYFPKKTLLALLSEVQAFWGNQPEKIITQANEIQAILVQAQTRSKKTEKLGKELSQQAIKGILASFDDLQGGFGQAPKFPHESMLLLLIDEQKRQPTAEKLNAITLSLEAMAQGGLYDVIGGGFARYSTDNAWLVPHFEKMLYNQAQLALAYAQAYQLTQKPLYARIVRQTLDYLLREMHADDGGFYSATDADSEGEEGTFFIWDIAQIKALLKPADFAKAQLIFDLSSATLFEDKHIIRYQSTTPSEDDFTQADAIISTLYKARQKRIPPLLDNKILLSWNAMAASTFLQAGLILGEQKYLDTAIKTLAFLQTFAQNGQLKRVFLNRKYNTDALLEDYAHLISLHLDMFDYKKDETHLTAAKTLMQTAITQFWDEKNHGFTNHQAKYLYLHLKNADDGAIPSANALMFAQLIRLFKRTNDNDYAQYSQQLLDYFSAQIKNKPQYYATLIIGMNNLLKGEINTRQSIYQGKIRAHLSHKNNNDYTLTISMAKGYHINSNKPTQKDLIATSIVNLDDKNWQLNPINYPKPTQQKLSFSAEPLSVYQGNLTLPLTLKLNSTTYTPPKLSLNLQACNDTICLPPTSVILH